MATTFYGPWHVVLGLVNFHFSKRFIISKSDNADGIYPVVNGNAIMLSIQGGEWQIQIENLPFDPGASWQPSIVRESMKFVLGEGLIVQLDGLMRFPDSHDLPFHIVTLTCTSMDPEINPIPTANPFSFTLGDRPIAGSAQRSRVVVRDATLNNSALALPT